MAVIGNVYKPRYKIAYQAKSKIWPYKNSRLRRFFNIRGRRIVRGGAFRRYVLVFNSMKWTIARRFIRPYRRKKKGVKRQYRNAFYRKQQLRHFYGKMTENAFRKLFRTHLRYVSNRNRSFFAALERRLDMFFFRMRFLPTIYACHQFVHYHGLVINRWSLEKSPNALINVGDIVAIPKPYWRPISKYLKYRIFFRLYGKRVLKKRQYFLLKRKLWWKRRSKWFRFKRFRYWVWRVYKLRLLLLFYSLRLKFVYFFKRVFRILHCLVSTKAVAAKRALVEASYCRLFSFYHFFVQFSCSFGKELKSFWYHNKRVRKLKRWYRKPMLSRRLLQLIRGFVLSYNLKLLNFSLKLKLEELNFYGMLVFNFLTPQKPKVISSFLRERKAMLVTHSRLAKDKLIHYFTLLARKEIRKENRRIFFRKDEKTGRWVARNNILTFFLIHRRYKKERRLSTPRLKPIHWYVPTYIYFDARTLRGILLYSPQSDEIIYSFRCSLLKIHAFYKSLGL